MGALSSEERTLLDAALEAAGIAKEWLDGYTPEAGISFAGSPFSTIGRIEAVLAASISRLAHREPEARPFLKGERVYVLWLEGTQPPGTACREGRVIEDDGRDNLIVVQLADGQIPYFPAERVRRDRRGKQQPVYYERPLTPEEKESLRGR
jgi:hypothetical protein